MDCVGSQGDHFPYINHITSHITRESTTYQPHVNYISTTYQWYHINHIPIFHKSTASVNHPSYSHGIGDVRQLCGLLHGDALWCVEDLKRGSGWVQKISCYLTIYLPWTLVMYQKKWFYYHGNMIIYFIISYLGFSINMATSKCICSVQWKIPLTWMIRGYPHFRKPPCKLGRNCRVYVKRVFFWLVKMGKRTEQHGIPHLVLPGNGMYFPIQSVISIGKRMEKVWISKPVRIPLLIGYRGLYYYAGDYYNPIRIMIYKPTSISNGTWGYL